MKFEVHEDIKQAETLPGSFYKSQEVFDQLREKVFLKTWQFIGHDHILLPHTESAYPFMLLDSFIGEPLVLVRDKENAINCLSNVCTHRGNIVVHNSGKVRDLSCMYHGRRFELNGKFKMMPEFKETDNFPRPCDDLKSFPTHKWGPFIFSSLEPSFDFSEVVKIFEERVGFLPLSDFKLNEDLSKDYLVNAHWALYCDNYLEGFHIPFVHEDLNAVLDYGSYSTEIFEHVNLQIGIAKGGEEVFDLPEGHIDYGKNIAAYYFWVFPNMMFNFYPWGLSINIIKPQTLNRTKVSFITYIHDETALSSGAGALLDKVEREDEFVVEGVQKGLQSRYYTTGRFSPTKEKGVHHFQRLLAKYLGK